jgi:thiol-disulfide isomerase/thioredoxin
MVGGWSWRNVLTFVYMRVPKFLTIVVVLSFFLNTTHAQTIPSWKVGEMQKYLEQKDSVMVVSFWATFCKPCMEEIPYLQSLSRKYNAKVLLVSLDFVTEYPAKIISTAKEKDIYSPIVWLNETNADYFCPKIDKAWDGGIPATLFVNNKKGYRHLVDHQMKEGEFEEELKKAL